MAKVPQTIYRTIRIDFEYENDTTTLEEAVKTAASYVVLEALSNALYDGENDGVKITDITDCGANC